MYFLLGKTFLVKLHCELKLESERCGAARRVVLLVGTVHLPERKANKCLPFSCRATFAPMPFHDFSSGKLLSGDLIKRDSFLASDENLPS